MLDRDRNTQGFTLAELLLAIAIVLVLAALAAPSISNIQRNMRMLELDGAASDIAVAAQHQMTSMKVSGTWLALFDGDSPQLPTGEQRAANVPSAVADNHPEQNDLYYMTADQARAAGIMPAGSIDEAVRNGDYLIEYSLSTATVFGVFYTDGKTGFFQTAPANIQETKPAQAYYATMTSEAGRTQDARIKADTMIGYFGGTPAGATNEVALANPNIWVDKEGWLCIQDPNLSKHSEWHTSLEVVIEKEDGSASLAFAGLQRGDGDTGGTTYQAGVDLEDAVDHGYANKDETKLYTVVDRDADILAPPSSSADVYRLNLEMLKTSGDDHLAALAAAFSDGVSVKVTATVKTGQKPYAPAESTAYIEWPDPLITLNVVVTDPTTGEVDGIGNPVAGGSHIKGTYAMPEVKASPRSGSPLVINNMQPYSEAHEIPNTHSALTGENTEAAYQRYAGGRIGLDQAISDDVLIEAAVGSYTSPARRVHYYQIHELWIGVGSDPQTSTKERIGYLVDNRWQWAGKGTTLSRSISGITANEDTADPNNFVASIHVDPVQLQKDLDELGIADQAFTLYVRTGPCIDEARTYFTGKQDRLGKGKPGGQLGAIEANLKQGITTGSRGIDAGSKLDFRKNFENEFGCPSSDVSYAITRKASSDQSPIQEQFPGNTEDIRIYYAVTPAYGFNKAVDAAGNDLPNTALWYYNSKQKTVYPQAMVYPTRSGGVYNMAPTSNNADFEFRTDRDYLFYRVLRYYESYERNDAGKIIYADPLPIEPQYVPFSANNDPSVATFATADAKTAGNVTKVGAGWKTFNVNTYLSPAITELEMQNGDLVGAYHEQLDYKGTYLIAQYQDLSAGMMYLEFAAGSNEAIGWSGYTTPDSKHFVSALPDNTVDIDTWGYYVIVPSGSMSSQGDRITKTGQGTLESSASKTVTVNGVSYDAYRLTGTGNALKANQEIAVTLKKGNSGTTVSATYTLNYNFASAVTIDSTAADLWGKSESPWSVRHATQFIGALPWVGSVQSEYTAACFKQDHDIDMLDAFNGPAVTNSNYKFTSVFTGSYDGQLNAITGFERAVYFMNGENPQGHSIDYDGSKDFGQGLFPYVLGDHSTKGVLKNIKLVAQADALYYSYGTKSHASFGWLVGVLDNATVEGCSFVGLDSAGKPAGKDNEAKMILEQSSAGTTSIGLLVGKAKNGSTLKTLSVAGVEMIYQCASGRWDKPLRIGGIAGALSQSTAESCTVSHIALKLLNETVIQSKHAASVGGMFGLAEQATVSQCSIVDTSLVMPGLRFEAGGSAYFGLIAGTVSGANVAGSTIRSVAVTMNGPMEFNADSRIVAFGGLVGGADIDAAGGTTSSVTGNSVSSLTVTFEATQGSAGLAVGWAVGRAGSVHTEDNVSTEPSSYRIGERGKVLPITDPIGSSA